MPDFRISVNRTAGVGKPSRASVGATIPAVLRPNSVAVAVQGIGVSGPTNAVGAGVLAIATAVPVPGVIAAVDPFDPNDLDSLQQRQFTGGRPSGLGEAIKALREAYRKGERNLTEDTRAAAQRALALQEEAVRRYNEVATRNGLPTIELPSDVLAHLVDREGNAIGDPSGMGGALVGSEVMPAWRADP